MARETFKRIYTIYLTLPLVEKQGDGSLKRTVPGIFYSFLLTPLETMLYFLLIVSNGVDPVGSTTLRPGLPTGLTPVDIIV